MSGRPEASSNLQEKWLRWYVTLCSWLAGFLFLWMLVSPAIGPRHAKHTPDDFDTSSVFYLLPLLLHPFTGIAYWLSPRKGPRAQRATVLLRLTIILLAGLSVITLVSRVVTLKAYCRLKGIVQLIPDEYRDPWKHCSSARMGSAAVVAAIYAIVSLVEIQLEALIRRQQKKVTGGDEGELVMDAWRSLLGGGCEPVGVEDGPSLPNRQSESFRRGGNIDSV